MEEVLEASRLIWPKQHRSNHGFTIKSWAIQGIYFEDFSERFKIGLVQKQNGPCGVLSIVHAYLVVNRLKESGDAAVLRKVTDSELAKALGTIISVCAEGSGEFVKVVLRDGSSSSGGGDSASGQPGTPTLKIETVNIEMVSKLVLRYIEQFKSPGGVILLIYSCVLSHGVSRCSEEADSNLARFDDTLIDDLAFCTSELMSLLLRGTAHGNLSAFGLDLMTMETQLTSFPVPSGIGLLSLQETQPGAVSIANELKHPELPVWIIHSGDHYCLLFQERLSDPSSFLFWNGLPPAGPRECFMKVTYSAEEIVKAHKEVLVERPSDLRMKGEIEEWIRVHPEDGKLLDSNFGESRHEVLLVAANETKEKFPEKVDSGDMKAPTFPLGQAPKSEWRCANCYRQKNNQEFQQRWKDKYYKYGLNEALSQKCSYCGEEKDKAQWTVWLKASDLPSSMQAFILGVRRPNTLLKILRTRWRDLVVHEPPMNELKLVL